MCTSNFMKKYTLLIIILVVVIIISLIIVVRKGVRVDDDLIGGDRDEHGCLGSAGYTWNETDQMCVREWTRKKCSPESRGPNLYCIQVYDPVCGLPIKVTFSNSCAACLNNSVEYYVEGECQ